MLNKLLIPPLPPILSFHLCELELPMTPSLEAFYRLILFL